MKTFYWRKFKPGAWWLFPSPKGTPRSRCGGIGKHWVRDSWPARYTYEAYLYHPKDGRPITVSAGTLAAARKRLEAEIDKQSIGLFGEDDVAFVVED